MTREKNDCSIAKNTDDSSCHSSCWSILTHTTQANQSIVTLRDLKNVVSNTSGIKTPTFKELRKQKPLLQQLFQDGGLWVYENGFAAYQAGKRTTVLRIARASSHTYEFSDGEENCLLNDQPWAAALVMYGEARIEQNIREWDERRHVCYDNFDNFDDDGELMSAVVLVSTDDVEQVVLDRNDDTVEQMLSGLTARQRQVVEMYYMRGMTQQAIADELGIAHQVVDRLIKAGIRNLKNFSRKI